VVSATQTKRRLEWAFLGRLAYARAERLQCLVRDRIRSGLGEEALLLLEHPHVFTLGRNADAAEVLVDKAWLEARSIEVVSCDRGGRVTYHGPGQLVGYPILDLNPDRRDLRKYVQDLQAVLVNLLKELGIEAEARRRTEELGVWVGDSKIASIGVHVSRWITTHGFALNVDPELEYFSSIVPCGLHGVKMTSIAEVTHVDYELGEIAALCIRHFAQVFAREPVQIPFEQLKTHWPIAS